ncbi:putative Zn-dependent peptidase [Hyella patelloides LEGE 07179]|uniref:Putative Zn-dependent peptidase n=1 Tax=Hyella patelloides LEGE 07179 TaxID=945734 RepID=A0A563W417_9CYAN|nr:pitrilysin family protein [Hyella patelloides]VEP18405.1 putative Zn-dependent peptidase [Hyella patelloides LEGE 07179]
MLNWRQKSIFSLFLPLLAIAFGIVIGCNWVVKPVVADVSPSPEESSIQPYLDSFSDRITGFRLANEMKFIVLENHDAPVVSFVTYADVGGVDEPDGQTGVAHFLEHLAFKGTKEIGTKDYRAERRFLDRLDRVFTEIKTANDTGDRAKLQQLTPKFARLQSVANSFVEQNEYGQIVDTAGGVGLNAATSADYTSYFYSFPANKLELWMSLESERFLEPVFREFYKEKQVILEERRLRTDNSPLGKTIEQFLGTAFSVHPYKRPTIGFNEDIRNLTRKNVRDFFNKYYTPNNLTLVVAGDVQPNQVKKLAKTYFGRFPKQPEPPTVTAIEPPQQETKEFTVELPTQPWYLEGYHISGIGNPDYPIYEVISSLLSSGRTSRLYQSLVENQQIALSAQGFSGFPGDKYPNLMLFYAMTAPGHNVDELAAALKEQINLLKTQPVTEAELNRVKTQLKAGLLRSLNSNMGMARLLAEYEAKTGTWRKLFDDLQAIIAVTPEDIQRIAQTTFTEENRTVGKLLSVSN